MKIYDYQGFSEVYLGGSMLNNEESLIPTITNKLSSTVELDVHPKEIERQERLKRKRKKSNPHGMALKRKGESFLNNSVIIFSGSVGLGTKSFDHFDEIFKKLNEIIKKDNTHILLVRGNNDDPSYFNDEKINYSNIKAVEDYSIIKFHNFNCLCIGGGISLDRKWKMTQGERLKRDLYWKEEATVFNPEELQSIIADNKIDCVVTHESPTFIGNDTSIYLSSKWAASDKEAVTDAINERLTIDRIYSELVKANKKPYVWHFTGNCGPQQINNIRFVSSQNLFNIFSLNDTVEGAFGFRLEDNSSFKDSKKHIKMVKGTLSDIQRNRLRDTEEDNIMDDLMELDGNAEMEDIDADVDPQEGDAEPGRLYFHMPPPPQEMTVEERVPNFYNAQETNRRVEDSLRAYMRENTARRIGEEIRDFTYRPLYANFDDGEGHG